MSVRDLLEQMRDLFDPPAHHPAGDADLRRLQAAVGPLPDDVFALYRDHDGEPPTVPDTDAYPAARLLPIDEAVETHGLMASVTEMPRAGELAWLWTDDNSNYVGVYTSGPLAGWLTNLDHAGGTPTPAYRSVAAFLHRLIASATGGADPNEEACDVISIPREVPATRDDPHHVDGDRRVAAHFRALAASESNEDLRRFYASCAICLTPVADTASVLPYLAEDDIWLPEMAVGLLEVRGFDGGIAELERLARSGRHNGDQAALRHLARLDTAGGRAAVDGLRASLPESKRGALEWQLNHPDRVAPARWEF